MNLERADELNQGNIMRGFMFLEKVLTWEHFLTVGAFKHTLTSVF